MPLLRKLLRKARQMEDNGLIGFCYFHMADVYYTLYLDYEQFRQNLRKSIQHLLRSDETELLARAYNFVGIDALNMGCFDVGYNYFMTALRVGEKVEDSVIGSIAYANIAHIYYRLGEFKEARRMFRKDRLASQTKKDDVYYHRNLLVSYYSEGLVCMELGLLNEAERFNKKIDRIIQESNGKAISGNEIPLIFFRIMLMIRTKKKREAEVLIGEANLILHNKHLLFDFIDDIRRFCLFMLSADRPDVVRMVLDHIEDAVDAAGVIYMRQTVSEIQLAYYEKVGNKRMIQQSLRKQFELSASSRSMQEEVYLYSMELIKMADDVRKEQKRVLLENRQLRVQANEDALTGIPNRYAMNQQFREILERAQENRHMLSLEILDIDFFKQYNDTYGHLAGDGALEKLANVLIKLCETPGISCARYGGDEFVILYEAYSRDEVLAFAKQLDKDVRQLRIRHKGSQISDQLTISQGIYCARPKKKSTFWEYFSLADNALYSVKETHRKKTGAKNILLIEG